MLTRVAVACAACCLLAGCGRDASNHSQAIIRRWIVTPDSAGPLRIGMHADSALAALGQPPATARRSACDYLKVGAPVQVMVENDTVVRFDVTDTAVATAEGARVGDEIARIERLYSARVRSEPRKYTEGKNLIVTKPGDTTRQMIFETDRARVVTYRAGRLPAVAYVERCG